MNIIKSIKLGTKLFGTVIVLVLLTAIIAGVGIMKMNVIGNEIKAIAEEDIPLIEVLTEIESAQLEQAIWFEQVSRFGEVLAAEHLAKKILTMP